MVANIGLVCGLVVVSCQAVLAWSFTHLSAGTQPTCRHDGKEFKLSGYVGDKQRAKELQRNPRLCVNGVLLQVRGDWCHYKQMFQFAGWGGEGPDKRCCWVCKANKGTLPFTDPSVHAEWRRTMISHATYLTDCESDGKTPPALFSIPGFCISYVGIDLMHVADLGITQYLCGR